MGNYIDLKPFKFWCQKVLPLVYDDSLSYYELLCKVVDYLNKTIENVETLHSDVTNLHTDYEKLQSYVNNYFSSLDVQEEINNKLDDMVNNGELDILFSKYIPYAYIDSYGAVGDGVTDDTASIINAINSKNIIVGNKNKTYKVKNIIVDKEIHFINCNFIHESAKVTKDMEYIIKANKKSSFYNCSFESYLEQIPLINILNGVNLGEASNVFGVWCLGDTEIINCSFKHIYGCDCRGKTTIKDSVFTECEMGIFINTNSTCEITNCNIECSRKVSSSYFHAIYCYKATNITCSNIIIKESAGSVTGNHLHFYRPGGDTIETHAVCDNILFEGDIVDSLIQNNNADLVISNMKYDGITSGNITQSGAGKTKLLNCSITVHDNTFLNCRNKIEIYNSTIKGETFRLCDRCSLLISDCNIVTSGNLDMTQDIVVDLVEIYNSKFDVGSCSSLNVGDNGTQNIINGCYYRIRNGGANLLARGFFLNNVINETKRNLNFETVLDHNSYEAFFYQNNTLLKRVSNVM